MKRIPIVLTICLAAVCSACIWSRGSAFFSSFSLEKLVQDNKSNTGLACAPNRGGGGGGSIGTSSGGIGFGGKQFHSHKGDSFSCQLKSDEGERFDEPRIITALQLDVEKALSDSGAKIIDRGNPGPASFYLAYTLQNIEGRVQISGKRSGGGYYSLSADLNETGK
ncbi:MAG TPA: hypothetical protein VK582_24790 [Pyrinomonadaceae bacterium]|nr:hypothetical protein [Pyrinomonadaceae bacterium]